MAPFMGVEFDAPPSRSYWKGYLRVGLVTIPVQAHSAIEPRAALGKAGRLGLGQITKSSGREYLVAVGPVDKGIAMYILRYANEIRSADKYFENVPDKPSPVEMVALATQLIEEHISPFVADQFQNSDKVALMDVVKR